ncbi:hypothetical protein EJ06DRAFT_534194 [Trichodelitschia bisporula]|uniref:DH domain-containing protein n=1 Tax=Trichodelitschia bisporula TaxID=703511 RepID=A0A6G1HKD5_9PEZI|nr:hypothetical protein EJ06DRAFT_534194 [Trichodelitschia bisporula]
MPAPLASQTRASAPAKAADPAKPAPKLTTRNLVGGKPIDVHSNATVRDKVRKWHLKGGGVITQDDVLADSDAEVPAKEPVKEAKESREPSVVENSKELVLVKPDGVKSDVSSRSKGKGESVLVAPDGVKSDVSSRSKGKSRAGSETPVVVVEYDTADAPATPQRSHVSIREAVTEPARPRIIEHRPKADSAEGRIVDPPSTPHQSDLSLREPPATDPLKPRIVERKPRPNTLDEEIHEATAPKKRVVSDSRWRRQHSPTKPTQPKEPAPPPASNLSKKDVKLAWVRPPLLPRQSGGTEEPPKPKPKPPAKPIGVYSGKVQQPRRPLAATVLSPLLNKLEGSFLDTPPQQIQPLSPPRTRSTLRKKPPQPRATSPDWVSSDDDDIHPSRNNARRRRSSAQPEPFIDRRTSKNRRKSRETLSEPSLSSSEESPERRPSDRRRNKSAGPGGQDYRGYVSDRRPSSDRRASMTKKPSMDAHDIPHGMRRENHMRSKTEGSYMEDRGYKQSPRPRQDHDYGRTAADYRSEYEKFAPRRDPYDTERSGTVRRKQPPAYEAAEDEPPPLQPVSGNRVEAWLSGTPDPFTTPKKKPDRRVFSFEQTSKLELSPSDVTSESHSPDVRSSKRKSSSKKSKDLRVETELRRHVRAHSEPLNHDLESETGYSSTTSASTLKRSGAHRGHARTPTRDLKSPRYDDTNTDVSTATSLTESSRLTETTVTDSSHLTGSVITESVITESTITDSTLTESTLTESDLTSSALSSSVDPRQFELPELRPRPGMPGYVARRMFPSTGKRLSTIASVETFNTKAQQAPPSEISEGGSEVSQATERPASDIVTDLPNMAGDNTVGASKSRASLKRRLTKHSDLMTVLSMPGATRSKSIISARSIRTHRSRLETATVQDLMRELASDESKYMRELRTLADSVIPVLLKCLLSKSEASVAVGLFNKALTTEKEAIAATTKTITDMSIAVKKLKTLHKRIPKESHTSFLIWAQSAHKHYSEYVGTWRLGFQDVVVNLVAEEGASTVVGTQLTTGIEDGMQRNDEGYIVTGDGERVDVEYLLRRPLVRLKYLTKTVKGINYKQPSEATSALFTKFQNLLDTCRKKINDERARIEDEVAAMIDATRARDPRTLAPLAGVKIDPTRRVRARDFFDLSFSHSSGQQFDSRIEMLMRDDAPGKGNGGDVLICDVDVTGRWLFLPPVQLNRISTRAGDEFGEIVVMIRGGVSTNKEWREMFTLRTDDEEVRFEWISMLGLTPEPPKMVRTRTFREACPTSSHGSSLVSTSTRTDSTYTYTSGSSGAQESLVPIGARPGANAKKWSADTPERRSPEVGSPVSPPSSDSTSHHSKLDDVDTISTFSWGTSYIPAHRRKTPEPIEGASSTSSILPQEQVPDRSASMPRDLNEAMALAGRAEPSTPTLKRTTAKRYHHRKTPSLPTTPEERCSPPLAAPTKSPVQPSSEPTRRSSGTKQTSSRQPSKRQAKKPESKGFSVWLPTSDAELSDDSDKSGEETSPIARSKHNRSSSVPILDLPNIPKLRKPEVNSGDRQVRENRNTSGPSRTQTKSRPPSGKPSPSPPEPETPPPPPPHRSPSSSQGKLGTIPTFTPTPTQQKRRSSSPLKHEYQPSSPSLTSSSSEEYTDDDISQSSSSDSEDDSIDNIEDDDIISQLSSAMVAPSRIAAQERMYSIPNAPATVTPSQSASQAPYRKVVKQSSDIMFKTYATVFAWLDDRGRHDNLHTSECLIVVSPGLIEAFDDGSADGPPLIALELTPIVSIHRGTVIDVSIQSPVTEGSKLKPKSRQFMFRVRDSLEAEAFYGQVNKARNNNPTYKLLQDARPAPPADPAWASGLDRANSFRAQGAGPAPSFWNIGTRRSRSYRASTRAPSTAANTESSVRTIQSVLSAMKRLGASRLFSNTRANSSNNEGSFENDGSGGETPPTELIGGAQGLIASAKVRLYTRPHSTSRNFRDIGSGRLFIKRPEPDNTPNAPARLHTGSEKRVMVVNEKRGNVMLDVTLGSMCFEPLARVGIAVSVWENVAEEGGVAHQGGVSERRVRLYVLQLKDVQNTAYILSLLRGRN